MFKSRALLSEFVAFLVVLHVTDTLSALYLKAYLVSQVTDSFFELTNSAGTVVFADFLPRRIFHPISEVKPLRS